MASNENDANNKMLLTLLPRCQYSRGSKSVLVDEGLRPRTNTREHTSVKPEEKIIYDCLIFYYVKIQSVGHAF